MKVRFKLSKREKNDMAAILFILAVYIVLALAGIGCPIRFFTGISCPGCGMTRAWLCAVRMDLTRAFHYHPLFWSVIPLTVTVLFRHHISKFLYNALITTFIVLFIAVYLLRMFDGGDDVVTFNICSGAISGALKFIIGGSKSW